MKTLRNILCIWIVSAYAICLHAQSNNPPAWAWGINETGTLDASTANSKRMCTDSIGNIYTLRHQYAANTNTITVTKYDSTGAVLWSRAANSAGTSCIAGNIAIDATGNYYISGNGAGTFGGISLSGASNNWVIKYNAAGTLQWAKNFGTKSAATVLAVSKSGIVYVAGPCTNDLNYNALFKFNTAGAQLWYANFTASCSSCSTTTEGIALDNNGNIYLTGYGNEYYNSGSAHYVSKVDTDGNLVWLRGGSNTGRGADIVADEAGNCYVTGYYINTMVIGGITLPSSGVGANNIFIAKYNSTGQVEWARHAGGVDQDYGNAIAIDALGNSYVTGRIQQNTNFTDIEVNNINSGLSDVFVAKYDSKGEVVWVKNAGSNEADGGACIGLDKRGNIYLSGYYGTSITLGTTVLSGTSQNAFIAKIPYINTGAVKLIRTSFIEKQTYAAGQSIVVPFTTEGDMGTGATYSVELSQPFGSFSFATVIGIGTGSSITAVIPANAITGNSYRVRVISSNAGITSIDNGNDISINGNGTQKVAPKWVWAKSENNNFQYSSQITSHMCTDSQGNTITVSSSYGTGSLLFTRYDANGAVVWTRNAYSGSGTPVVGDLAIDGAGNYYIAGRGNSTFGGTTLSGPSELFAVKYTANGTVAWAVNIGTKVTLISSTHIAVDNTGNVYVTSGETSNNNGVATLSKISGTGTLTWKIEIASAGMCVGCFSGSGVGGMDIDGFGNIYLTGSTLSSSGSKFFINKIDPSGTSVWLRAGSNTTINNALKVDANGNSYVTGGFFGTFTLGTSTITATTLGGGTQQYYDIFIAKYDAAGQLVWLRSAGSTDTDEGAKIAIDTKGNSYITGRYQGFVNFGGLFVNNASSGAGDIFVAKYDAAGAILWVQQAGLQSMDAGTGIGVDASDNVYVQGYFSNKIDFNTTITLNGGKNQVFIARIGNVQASYIGKASILTNKLCAGGFIKIDYPVEGSFTTTNVFTAQLSNASGSFAAPVTLKTLDGKYNNAFYATIPANTPAGTKYRIRVIASDPTVTGLDNGADLTINTTNCQSVTPVLVPAIAAAEYFIDTDPGQGQGTSFAFFTESDSINLIRNISLGGLSSGFHNIFIRTKNKIGQWSHYEGRVFYIQPTAETSQSSRIVAAEYFIDTDPGAGLGTAISGISKADSINITAKINTTVITSGFHNIFIRVKDSTNRWSHYEGRAFYIQPASELVKSPPIVGAEYFIDTDPGVGLGTAISGISKADSININAKVNTTAISPGFHNIFIRVKDSTSRWSHYEGRVFYVQPVNAALYRAKITGAEYFIDTDPGLGLGTPITGISKNDSINISTAITLTGLTGGQHYLFIRVKDSTNTWSHYEGRKFNICSAPLAVPGITGSAVICQNKSLTLAGSNVASASSYLWKGPDSFSQTGNTITRTQTVPAMSGEYTFYAVRAGATSCDTVSVKTVVTINPAFTVTNPRTICKGASYSINKHNYTLAGTYKDTLVTRYSCDSLITTTLTVKDTVLSNVVTVSPDGNTLTSSESNATYQWIDCANNQPVTDATQKSYTSSSKSGSYAVIVTSLDCGNQKKSQCSNIVLSMEDEVHFEDIHIYPNPARNILYMTKHSSYVITNLLGQAVLVSEGTEANVSSLAAGVYFIRINDKVTKFIKE